MKVLAVVCVLVSALLLPKVTGLALHYNSNITAVVICTGTEMVTIHIDADGNPVEMSEAKQAPCILTNPNAIANRSYAQWTVAPRSYRATFVDTATLQRSEAEVGQLPDPRGPPFVI